MRVYSNTRSLKIFNIAVLKKVAAAADAISPDYKIAIDVSHSAASASK